MPCPISHKDVQNIKEVVEKKSFVKKSMTEDGNLMSSISDLKVKVGDDVTCQKVTTGNYSL